MFQNSVAYFPEEERKRMEMKAIKATLHWNLQRKEYRKNNKQAPAEETGQWIKSLAIKLTSGAITPAPTYGKENQWRTNFSKLSSDIHREIKFKTMKSM